MNETIDILMATYNGERYLKEQLDSILKQTYKKFNLIISDDASTDNTIKILKQYEQKDKRIKVFYNKKNKGFLKNFEFLCQQARTNLCMFCDQDDVWKSNKIEKLYNFMKKTNAVLSFCDMEITNQNLETINPSFHQYIKKEKRCEKYNNFDLLKLENVISGCSILVKKDIIKKSIPFPKEIFVYDWWISLIATQHGQITYLNEPLQYYRQHDSNSIGAFENNEYKTFEEYRKELIDFKRKQFKILKEKSDLFKKEKKYIQTAYNYFSLLNERKMQIKNCFKVFKIYKTEKISRKLKMLLLFNFPLMGKIMYNIKYKGV